MSSSSFKYSVHRIPTSSPHASQLVERYKNAKLAALLAEPTGFAVQHKDEVLLSPEVWTKRVAEPSTIFICIVTPVAHPELASDEETLLSGEWVGFVTVRGPIPYFDYFLPESGQPVPANPDLETRWHLCNLYTAKVHRGKGLGRALVNACIEFVRIYSANVPDKSISTARLRLFMDAKKTALVGMYKKMLFQEAGWITLREAFIANGDAELIPRDTTSTPDVMSRWERRVGFGLAMERLIHLAGDEQ